MDVSTLEQKLDCTILSRVNKGESLTKYHALIGDQPVMLRIFEDQYYGNRFLREGIVLRELQGYDLPFKVPRIIEEWPEYNIRAIEWIDHAPCSNPRKAMDAWKHMQDITLQQFPYTLQQDLVNHLSEVDQLHIAYQDFFAEKISSIFNTLDWGDAQNIVHGDFHMENMGIVGDMLIIFDWEFASMGNSLYDRAYFNVYHGSPEKDPWHALATATICHWYLRDDIFSPKQAIYWVEQLAKLV